MQYFTLGGMVSDLIRATPHFQRFKQEHSDLEQKLTGAISNSDSSIPRYKCIKLQEDLLYEAYLIMHSYGVSDNDLMIGPK